MLHRRRALSLLAAGGAAMALPGWTRASAQGTGWRPLWDGRSLDGWSFWQDGVGDSDTMGVVSIRNEELHFLGDGYAHDTAPPGFIATMADHGNYHLRLQYRWGERRWAPRGWQARNSGVLYHMGPQRSGLLFPEGIEFQMQEGNCGDAILIDALGVQGPSLGGTPLWPNWIPAFSDVPIEPTVNGGYARRWLPRLSDFERAGEWNTLDLVCFGDQAAQLVNGRIVNTLFKLRRSDGTTSLTSGRIALEFEWASVAFRQVMIRELDEAAIASIRRQGSD
ncbi:3-keto-disaccharide hydrolase [Alteraurantiacibacter buctensis]|uniref:DUF1080 domain-containing protein n=1 Tax=Alteraurantiacibacter buctensis TaxID=1503981 RepID=A0A844Z201_9SPHN|nr:DUF1080 domain-containing protein [Alteraurantiacibacter buctensis]MXO71933.1 DUF1080 domain-containing protein [Alteraurantiacibacter buctensis]